MSARIEVDVAKDNVIKALLAAQNAAVRNQLPVNVRFTEEQDMMRLEAKFTQRRSSFMLQNLPVYILPENITVTHDLGLTGMTFSPEGFPALDGLIRLSSKKNPGYFVEIPIADPG